jgi:hypothetical protein
LLNDHCNKKEEAEDEEQEKEPVGGWRVDAGVCEREKETELPQWQ